MSVGHGRGADTDGRGTAPLKRRIVAQQNRPEATGARIGIGARCSRQAAGWVTAALLTIMVFWPTALAAQTGKTNASEFPQRASLAGLAASQDNTACGFTSRCQPQPSSISA